MRIYDLEKNKRDMERIKKRSIANLNVIARQVKPLIENVKNNGDEAIKKYYTKKFGRFVLKELLVSDKEKQEAYDSMNKNEITAIKMAANNIRKFCKLEKPNPWQKNISDNILGQIIRPLDSIGAYVPSGRYPLPSSALMSIIPAKVAGVSRIVVCTPPKENGKADKSVVVAADIAGSDSIFKIGGAQAIAAMAYGTESVPRVDKIVGPGGVYVTAAKKLVSGDVEIDFLAGPTELLVIADKSANPEFVAADMLAQSEHDIFACALLLTNSKKLASDVKTEIQERLKKLRTADIARQSLKNYGGIILTRSLEEAIDFSNDFAPEHLEIMLEKPEKYIGEVKNAGGIFIGKYSAESFGDYASGTNHVLPTNGISRYRGGLSVRDFIKFISYQKISKKGMKRLKETTKTLARLEGLEAHAKAIEIRDD